MKNKVLSMAMTIMVVGVIMGTVQAQETELQRITTVFCSDNSTLSVNLTETRCIDGVCKELSRVNEEYCAYGCDDVTSRCSPDPFNRIVYYVIPIIGGFIIILWAILRMTRR